MVLCCSLYYTRASVVMTAVECMSSFDANASDQKCAVKWGVL